MKPKVSVIIRSYNRIEALCELLENLLNQQYDSFEVIVVEQSDDSDSKKKERLREISKDSRVTIHNYPPLGGPKARNTGVKHATGEILLFVDDDDLPENNQWIAQHAEAYSDKKLVGLTGRHIHSNDKYPYLSFLRSYIRRKCMSYTWYGTPTTFAQFDEDVCDVEWLHGTNASIRKTWVEKIGFWDTHVRNQDEHSFAFKLKPYLRDGYRLDFRKEPRLIRRLDIDGGMEKRKFSLTREFKNQYIYLRKILYKYKPAFIAIFPVHFIWLVYKVLALSLKKTFKN